VDYVHINPVKHGLVKQVKDWPYSTFQKLVEQGIYIQDWSFGMERHLAYED
jgi:putative transposase